MFSNPQVATGALYGFWMGLLVSWIGTSAGQCLAFLLGRYLFRPTVKTYLHNTWPTFPAIDTAIKKEGWKLVGQSGNFWPGRWQLANGSAACTRSSHDGVPAHDTPDASIGAEDI
jgi:hypothetical protein